MEWTKFQVAGNPCEDFVVNFKVWAKKAYTKSGPHLMAAYIKEKKETRIRLLPVFLNLIGLFIPSLVLEPTLGGFQPILKTIWDI